MSKATLWNYYRMAMVIEMNISGMYRDVLLFNDEKISDSGWRSNTIVPDCGRFFAALMKKDFQNKQNKVGIDYIAVGSGSADSLAFKKKFIDRLQQGGDITAPPDAKASEWIWAKRIMDSDINYLDKDNKITTDDITHKLEIKVVFEANEPSIGTFVFREFALFGIEDKDINRLFFINYVSHGDITKTNDMTRTLTLNLTFLG